MTSFGQIIECPALQDTCNAILGITGYFFNELMAEPMRIAISLRCAKFLLQDRYTENFLPYWNTAALERLGSLDQVTNYKDK